MNSDKTLADLKHSISQKVLGQPELIEMLLVTMKLHDLKLQSQGVYYKTDIMSNLLIIGPTGTGKTMAVREAVKQFGFRLIELNAKTFSQEGGWAGSSFSKQIDDQWVPNCYAPVIFIDEIDKVIRPSYESGGSDVNHSIQEGLLKFIEGQKTLVNKHGEGGHDLSNCCFIFAGAFTDMIKDKPKHSMGFFTEVEYDKRTVQQQLIEFGVMEELLGRINRIVVTNPVTKGMLYDIALNNSNIYNQYKQMMDAIGFNKVEHEVNLDKLIDKALTLGLGVRGLNQLFMQEIDKLVKLQFMDKTDKANTNLYHMRRLT